MAERIAVHRIVRHEDKVRRTIMPGTLFSLPDDEARQLDARGVTVKPGRQAVREPIVDISGVAERDMGDEAVSVAADPVAAKTAGKNGATTREKPPVEEEL